MIPQEVVETSWVDKNENIKLTNYKAMKSTHYFI